MAAIGITTVGGKDPVALTETTLSASDTLAYIRGQSFIMTLRNATAGALTPKLDGDGGTTQEVDGIGDVDLTAGYTFPSIGAGVVHQIDLDEKTSFLQGTVTMTGGLNMVVTVTRR